MRGYPTRESRDGGDILPVEVGRCHISPVEVGRCHIPPVGAVGGSCTPPVGAVGGPCTPPVVVAQGGISHPLLLLREAYLQSDEGRRESPEQQH